MSPTFRARVLAMIAAAATGIVSGCATASSEVPVAASSATVMVATPTGAATAGSGSASDATAGTAAAGSGSATANAIAGSATADATAGSATATPIPVESSPSPTGLPAGPVTQADNGKTFRLTVGQQITVVLDTPPVMWDQPAAQGSAVTRVSASGGYPGTTPAQAVFRAVSPGTAQVTSSTDMRCLHATPRCLPPQEVWSVSVVVV